MGSCVLLPVTAIIIVTIPAIRVTFIAVFPFQGAVVGLLAVLAVLCASTIFIGSIHRSEHFKRIVPVCFNILLKGFIVHYSLNPFTFTVFAPGKLQ
jgi:hypothetical protein